MKGSLRKSGFTLIELMVVLGIFTLIVGVSFALISTGRLSVFTSEAHIQAEERARQALNRISKELRLSKVDKFYIYTDMRNAAAAGTTVSGPVAYFQIPAGSYDSAGLELTPHYSLRWGDEDTPGRYIFYCREAGTNRLFRGTCNTEGLGHLTRAVGYGYEYLFPITATNISSLTFTREDADNKPNLITIEIHAKGKTASGEVTRSLKSRIKLRN